MTYLILKKKYQEPSEPTTYYALDKDLFEEKAISHTFNKYGQNISHGDAGDHLTLNTKQGVNVAHKVAEEGGYDYNFEVGETISAFDHESFYIDLLNGLEKEEFGIMCFTSDEYSIIKSYFFNDFEEYQILKK